MSFQQGTYSTDSTHKYVLQGKLALCKRAQDFAMRQLENGVECFTKVLAVNSDIEEFISNMATDDASSYSSEEDDEETENNSELEQLYLSE